MVEENNFVNRTRNSIRLAGPASGIVTKTIDLVKLSHESGGGWSRLGE